MKFVGILDGLGNIAKLLLVKPRYLVFFYTIVIINDAMTVKRVDLLRVNAGGVGYLDARRRPGIL